MQKIDRLGWAAGVSISSFGLKMGVRVSTPDVMDKVLERLPPGWEARESPFVDYLYSLKVGGAGPGGKVRSYHLLYFGLTRLARTMDLDLALAELESHLQWQVATNAPDRVMVHAGVVGWQGRAVVIPGYSHSGKSTLVAELLRQGATYYSDEYAVLDDRGFVHPYPRRLNIRQEGKALPRRYTPEELGSGAGKDPLPVGLVAVARYRPASRWQPRRLTSGQAVWELLNCTLTAERQPEAALDALQRVAVNAQCAKGFRGEAADTAGALLRQLRAA